METAIKNEKQVVVGEKVPSIITDRDLKRIAATNTLKETITALQRLDREEETVVDVQGSFECYPLDGIRAFNKALEKVFGYTVARGKGFGDPQRIAIEVAYGVKETFAYGEMAPPAWEGGSITMYVDATNPFALSISGRVKRKFEKQVLNLLDVAKEFIKTDSIYRGAAVELDLKYIERIEVGYGFDPAKCAPRFIDTSAEVDLILPKKTEFKLYAKLWGRIKRSADYIKNGVSAKYSSLFFGKYGTGKSLASAKTAKVAAENGWVFFYVKTPQFFMAAYRLAVIYAPKVVLFVEDVDTIFGGERDHQMNAILEALDGISSKSSEIITIFTTNFVKRINEAFRRPGRIDDAVEFSVLDALCAARFVRKFGGEALSPDVDYPRCGEAFKGLVPANVRGGLDTAKCYAIAEHGADIRGLIDTETLVTAAEVIHDDLKAGNDDEVIVPTEHEIRVLKAHRLLNN